MPTVAVATLSARTNPVRSHRCGRWVAARIAASGPNTSVESLRSRVAKQLAMPLTRQLATWLASWLATWLAKRLA